MPDVVFPGPAFSGEQAPERARRKFMIDQVRSRVGNFIPGLDDSQIPRILQEVADAGATRSFMILLRLPTEVKDVFFERLQESYPDRVGRVERGLRSLKRVS